jgi:hypothetical protein
MKTLNSIVKTIAALCIIGALFFSCSANGTDEYGTLVIKLPGSGSAREAASPEHPDFLDTLTYRTECSNGTKKVSQDDPSGKTVSISLPPGWWKVTLTVLDANNNEVGSNKNEPKWVFIESGRINSTSITIALDQYPYLGETLVLSGLVYGGKGDPLNKDKIRTDSAAVYAENDIGGNGEIRGAPSGSQLTFTIGIPETLTFVKTELEKMDMYKNTSLSDNTVQGAFLNLRAIGQPDTTGKHFKYILKNKLITTTENNIESVDYLYVDEDVTITAASNPGLNLKKGWNAIYSIENSNTKTFSLSLCKPHLQWVMDPIKMSDGNTETVNGTIGELADIPFTMAVGTDYNNTLSASKTHYYRLKVEKNIGYLIRWKTANKTVKVRWKDNPSISLNEKLLGNAILGYYLGFLPEASGHVIIEVTNNNKPDDYTIRVDNSNDLPKGLPDELIQWYNNQ